MRERVRAWGRWDELLAANHIDVDLTAAFEQLIDDASREQSLPPRLSRLADDNFRDVSRLSELQHGTRHIVADERMSFGSQPLGQTQVFGNLCASRQRLNGALRRFAALPRRSPNRSLIPPLTMSFR